jgi:nucleoside 2-deoxyribosyltransferase-like protein
MFYVAHRLFAAHDRRLGALAAAALAERVSADQVFLPFCDTDEEDLVAEVKGRRLFELDCQRLAHLTGMLAILHGPSLDDGVCMEIGYAAALGVPVVVFTTDFQTYGITDTGPELAFADPLVETVATEIVRAGRLGAADGSSGRFASFAGRNNAQLAEGLFRAADRVCVLTRAAHADPQQRSHATVFVEPSPYGATRRWEELAQRRSLGVHRYDARRWEAADPLTAAAQDWARARGCNTLLVDISGPETPPGAAILIGAGLATGAHIVAYCPRPIWTFASGREPNWRNLMIQYAVTEPITDADHR